VVFITAAEPAGGHRLPEPGRWLSAGLVFGAVIAVLAVLGTRGSPAPCFSRPPCTWGPLSVFRPVLVITDPFASIILSICCSESTSPAARRGTPRLSR
jgi:hypothetical protein